MKKLGPRREALSIFFEHNQWTDSSSDQEPEGLVLTYTTITENLSLGLFPKEEIYNNIIVSPHI